MAQINMIELHRQYLLVKNNIAGFGLYMGFVDIKKNTNHLAGHKVATSLSSAPFCSTAYYKNY